MRRKSIFEFKRVGEQVRKRLSSNLAGGLGNQLNCYFAALYFAHKYNYKIITLNSGTANTIHTLPNSLNSILPKQIQMKESKPVTINLEHKKTNLRLNGALRSFGSNFYSLYQSVSGILDDSNYTNLPEGSYHYFLQNHFKRVSLNGTKSIRFNGFFPSQRFYQELKPHLHSAESILHFEKIIKSQAATLEGANSLTYCVLHLRVGDYLLPGRNTFGVLNEQYYLDAISRVREEFPKIRIWAVSDDEQVATKLYPTLLHKEVELIRGLDTQSPLTTFEFIRNATVVICANSSFSFWAARLSSKVERTFIPSKPHLSIAGMKYLPDHWTRVDNGFF
jgi:hypothetical protein